MKNLIDFEINEKKSYKTFLNNFLSSKKKSSYKNFNLDEITISDNDYKVVKNLHKEIFNYIVPKIESYHKKKLNHSYWKIILYPWINALVNRIFILWKVFKKKKNFFDKVYSYSGKQFIPNSFNELNYNNNFHFNMWILSEIILFSKKSIIVKHKINIKKKINLNKNKNLIYTFLHLINKFLPKNRIVIQKAQFGFWNLVKLMFKLGQIPNYLKENNFENKKTNLKLRKKFFSTNIKKKNLKNFIKNHLVFLIPKNYLENFNSIKQSIDNSYWPKKTKLIITGFDDWYNDYFKIWAAEQKYLNNSKYILVQHGGKVGTEKINSVVDTQIKIADRYITWGWVKSKKTIPFYSILVSRPLKTNYRNKKKIFYFQKVFDKYFNAIVTNPMSMKSKINNINLVNDFYLNSNEEIKKNFILRYLKSFAENKTYYFNLINPKILKDEGNQILRNLVKEARVCIHDQGGTTFYETMSYNIPTILILGKNYINDLSEGAKKTYIQLEKNKIIFTSVKKAIEFLNNNYLLIENWWENQSTQTARRNFCNKFIKKTNSPVNEYYKLINKLIKVNKF